MTVLIPQLLPATRRSPFLCQQKQSERSVSVGPVPKEHCVFRSSSKIPQEFQLLLLLFLKAVCFQSTFHLELLEAILERRCLVTRASQSALVSVEPGLFEGCTGHGAVGKSPALHHDCRQCKPLSSLPTTNLKSKQQALLLSQVPEFTGFEVGLSAFSTQMLARAVDVRYAWSLNRLTAAASQQTNFLYPAKRQV